MSFNPDTYRRKSMRLPSYDYTRSGAYFITVCTNNREHLFGEICNDKVILNRAGQMIERWYDELFVKFPNIYCQEMVIMPNHIHMIIVMENSDKHLSIGTVVQWFKTMTTNEYIKGVHSNLFEPFHKRLWQRNYYEHVIRNEKSFLNIQEYIVNNPITWEDDMLYK